MSEVKKWTDAETTALLLAVVDAHITGGIKWQTVNLPEGRTIIACIRKLEKLRASVKDVKATEGGSPAKHRPKTSTQKKITPKKSKKLIEDDGDDEEPIKQEDGAHEHDTAENLKKRKSRTPASRPHAKKVKEEHINEDEAAE